jgi:uncharacterized protein YaiL (DUF2058 family)
MIALKGIAFAAKLFLPKLYPYIAMVLGTVAVLGIVYSMGKSSADQKAHIERIEADNALLRQTIQKQREAIEADNELSLQQSERIIELEDQTKEIIKRVQNPDAMCLDADDTDRLRDLWNVFKEGK